MKLPTRCRGDRGPSSVLIAALAAIALRAPPAEAAWGFFPLMDFGPPPEATTSTTTTTTTTTTSSITTAATTTASQETAAASGMAGAAASSAASTTTAVVPGAEGEETGSTPPLQQFFDVAMDSYLLAQPSAAAAVESSSSSTAASSATAAQPSGDNFACPPPTFVGCTALNVHEWEHECGVPGAPCDRPGGIGGEHCCVDECGRNFCTAKSYRGGGAGAGDDGVGLVQNDFEASPADDVDGNGDDLPSNSVGTPPPAPSPSFWGTKGDKDPPRSSSTTIDTVEALSDRVTTFTNMPVTTNVLFNDYVTYEGGSDGGSRDDGQGGNPLLAGDVSFGPSADLVLEGIVVNGNHGTCSLVVGDGDGRSEGYIRYAPNEGYSGTDKCGYEVCAVAGSSRKRKCSYGSLLVTIAKAADVDPIESGESLWIVGEEGGSVGGGAEDHYSNIVIDGEGYVDPDILLTDENWDEIEGVDVLWQGIDAADEDTTTPVSRNGCSEGESLVTIEVQTDQYAEDVSWELLRADDESVLIQKSYNGSYAFDQVDICLPNSIYTYTIRDEWGDGLCDDEGNCGHYKLYVDGREVVHVNQYRYNNTHALNLGYDATSGMTARDAEYLRAHNVRRRSWHEAHNVSYVPLVWSPGLAEQSLSWAVRLLDDCESDGIEHEPGVPDGENLAKNKGFVVDDDGEPSWGRLYPPESELWCSQLRTATHFDGSFFDSWELTSCLFAITTDIVRRWVEREIGWAYPDNAHLTQSLWRASKYLGCGEAEKDYGPPGGKCRVQVCRYAKAGNCGMRRVHFYSRDSD